MNKPLPSLGRYQALDATHIEILDVRQGHGQIKCYVDFLISLWGLRFYNVGLSFVSGKWRTVLPKREERGKGHFSHRVPVIELTTHAQLFFDRAVLAAANAYRGDQTVRRPSLTEFFKDIDAVETDDSNGEPHV